jgi:hypothetical protein
MVVTSSFTDFRAIWVMILSNCSRRCRKWWLCAAHVADLFWEQSSSAPLVLYELCYWRMVPSGMLRRVALVGTDVSEVIIATVKNVIRIGELGTTRCSFVPSSPILVPLMKEALSSSETSVPTRTTRRNIPEDGIIHRHRCENLKSCMISATVSRQFSVH